MAGGESQKGSESGNKVQGARRGAGCGEGRGEGRGPADTKLHGSMRLRSGEGRGRLMRPSGGERGVPGVPGAERDIPGGGETALPVTSGRRAQVRQHALPWACFPICTASYLAPHCMAPRAPGAPVLTVVGRSRASGADRPGLGSRLYCLVVGAASPWLSLCLQCPHLKMGLTGVASSQGSYNNCSNPCKALETVPAPAGT